MRNAVIVASILGCSACGGSPTGPVGPTPTLSDYSGLWSASLRYTSCTGDRQCVHRIGNTQPLTLRLQQSGTHVRGVFTTWTYAVDVEGDLLKDGSIVLSGGGAGASSEDDAGALTVTNIKAQLSDGVLTGTIAYDMRPQGDTGRYYTSLVSVAGTIEAGSRADLTMFASTFDGLWKGRFVLRSCTPIAPSQWCYPYRTDEVAPMDLTISTDGAAVTGTITILSTRIPVTGTVHGASIALEGEIVTPASGGGDHHRLVNWIATRDAFGRMTGSFDYSDEFPAAVPMIGEHAHAELWQVVKVQ